MIATDVGEETNISQPWLKYLQDEIEEFEKGSTDELATIIIRDILVANSIDEATKTEAALQLYKYAKDVHLRCDLMVRFSSFVGDSYTLKDNRKLWCMLLALYRMAAIYKTGSSTCYLLSWKLR